MGASQNQLSQKTLYKHVVCRVSEWGELRHWCFFLFIVDDFVEALGIDSRGFRPCGDFVHFVLSKCQCVYVSLEIRHPFCSLDVRKVEVVTSLFPSNVANALLCYAVPGEVYCRVQAIVVTQGCCS